MSGKSRLGEIISANRDTFDKLWLFSAALFISSIGSFLLVRSPAVGGRLIEDSNTRDVVAAVVGVVVCNCVVAAYVYSAFQEPPDPPSAAAAASNAAREALGPAPPMPARDAPPSDDSDDGLRQRR